MRSNSSAAERCWRRRPSRRRQRERHELARAELQPIRRLHLERQIGDAGRDHLARAQRRCQRTRHAAIIAAGDTAKSPKCNGVLARRKPPLDRFARFSRRGFRVAEPTVASFPGSWPTSGRLVLSGPDGAEHRLDAGHRLPGHVHAGRLRAGRDRPDPREERRPHDGHELPRLRDRHARLLGARVRAADGRGRGAVDVRRRRDAVAASSSSTSPARSSGCSGRRASS